MVHPAARMIDANANRAREALRVMEDAARFVVGSGSLSAEIKGIRHGLRAAIEGIGIDAGALLAARDTPGDVGTTITTEAEGQRAGVRDVVAAAAKRLTEALRVIEECAKVSAPEAAGAVEALRYRAYDAEQRLLLALGTGRARQWRVCVLITASLCRHHTWEEVARRAIAGGADCLQLREKGLPDRELLERARELVRIARGSGGDAAGRGAGGALPSVFINDRPDIAILAGADGVHLGQEDLDVADVRRLAGMSLLVGVSTQDMDQARRAVEAGADVCGAGPMFATTTKNKPVLAGPGFLRAYLADGATGATPHLAIGGITLGNIGELVAAGCCGVAVSAAVCGAEDPASVCRALVAALMRVRGGEEGAR